MKNVQFWQILFLSFFLASCATTRKERAQLHDLVKAKKYNEALTKIDQIKFYKEKNNKLLYHFEKGMILHRLGRYYQSSEMFRVAKEVISKNYTKRISQKAKTLVANDNFDIFYGSNYEHSHLHFYQMLNFFRMSQVGEIFLQTGKKQPLTPQKKMAYLRSARAELLAWDVTLENMIKTNKGVGVFKNDLIAKLVGGAIHESFRRSREDEIALQLYKDARTVLFRYYSAYKTFNKSFKKFIKDFKKLPKMKEDEVKNKYIATTLYRNDLKDFIDYKILTLTKFIRPKDFNNQKKILKPSKNILNLVDKQKRRNNVSVVLHTGLIPKKVGEKVYADLESSLEKSTGSKAVAKIGAAVIAVFAAHKLGLAPPKNNWSPAGAELGYRFSHAALTGAAIGFELPKILNNRPHRKYKVAAFDDKNKLIKEIPYSLINPVGDIAEEAIAVESLSRYTRLAIRLAVKHATAIVAAYGTYKGLESRSEFLAKAAAMGTYLASAKAIEMSERADTRYWSSLPAQIGMAETYLAPGKYVIKYKVNKSNNWRKLSDLVVAKTGHQILNHTL